MESKLQNLQLSLYGLLTAANVQTRHTCTGFLGIPTAFTEPVAHFIYAGELLVR